VQETLGLPALVAGERYEFVVDNDPEGTPAVNFSTTPVTLALEDPNGQLTTYRYLNGGTDGVYEAGTNSVRFVILPPATAGFRKGSWRAWAMYGAASTAQDVAGKLPFTVDGPRVSQLPTAGV
jgi:hypothetical protein